MPRHSNPGRLPTYRRHKASGQAVVVLNGQWNYLGPYGSAASRQAYNRLTAEWLRTGRGPLTTPSASVPWRGFGALGFDPERGVPLRTPRFRNARHPNSLALWSSRGSS